MYDSTEIELGQAAQDNISGFLGVVTTVGVHVSGCTRIGMQRLGDTDEPPESPSGEQFFYPEQLDVIEEDTGYMDLEPVTSVDYELGERIRDRSTEFEGRVHVVNFKLFNCPQALAYEIGGDVDSTRWVDDPFVTPMEDYIETPDPEAIAQATGAAVEDSASKPLSKH